MLDVAEGYQALEASRAHYETAHDYYAGEIQERFGSARLRRLLARQGSPFKVNLARIPADAVADRLEIVSTTVPGDDVATARLKQIWDANHLLFEAPNLHHRACEYGDAYLMVWEGEAEGDLPVLNYHSPLSMKIVYDTENPRRKKYAVHSWHTKTPLGDAIQWRANMLYADRIERFVTKPGAKPTDPEAWTEFLPDPTDPESWLSDNPYGEVPVFHFRIGLPYGSPVAEQGWGVQDAINKIVITHMSSIDFHGFPQRYALTDGVEADDDFDVDDTDFEDIGLAVPNRPEDEKGLETGPGEMWWLKNVKSVGQFSAADADIFLKPLTAYMRIMAQTTNTPLDIVDDSADPLSGEARRRKDGPFTKKVNDISQMFASEWSKALAFALLLTGLADKAVDVRYAPSEVVSDAEGWATVQAKIEAGVPVRQALLETGYSVEQVDQWFPEGAENTIRVADLVAVADILQKLGSAVALGIISEEEARAMLPEGLIPEGAPPPPPPPPVLPVPPVPGA